MSRKGYNQRYNGGTRVHAMAMKRLSTLLRTGRALGFEATSALLCSKFYALGVMGHPLPYLPTLRREHSPKLPVLFIHGVLHNPSAFVWIKQRLALAGWEAFDEINLYTTRDTVASMASQVAFRVEQLKKKHGVDQVDAVAHSLGGIVARYYLQFLGGDGNIRQLVTLGTPHRGTPWSLLSPWRHIRALHPRSQLMQRLQNLPVPQRTRIACVRGTRDVFLRHRDCGFWPGVRNIALRDLGHTGVLYSDRVVRILISHLSPAPSPSP